MTNVTKAINGKADRDKKKEECKRGYVISTNVGHQRRGMNGHRVSVY